MPEIKIKYDFKKVNKKLKKTLKILSGSTPANLGLAHRIHKDVINHFDKEMGSKGPMKPLKESTIKRRRTRKDKPIKSTKILQDSGDYRARMKVRANKKAAFVFAGVNYAKYHEMGTKYLPKGKGKRDVFWLSKEKLKKLKKIITDRIMKIWR